MNLFLIIGICSVILYLLLNFFAKASSKKIAKGIRYIIFTVGILLAIALFIVGRYAFSIPILIFLLPLLKLKGIGGIFQLIQLWRLISYLRQTGRYSFRSGTNYSNYTCKARCIGNFANRCRKGFMLSIACINDAWHLCCYFSTYCANARPSSSTS